MTGPTLKDPNSRTQNDLNAGTGSPDYGQLGTQLNAVFPAHELRVLGIMALLIGYLSIFFTKILHQTDPTVGVVGIAAMTLLLLFMGPEVDARSRNWWLRSFAIILLTLLLTAPQFNNAWIVSIDEERRKALYEAQVDAARKAQQQIQPQVSVSPGSPGAQ
jgi:hypothetical protein